MSTPRFEKIVAASESSVYKVMTHVKVSREGHVRLKGDKPSDMPLFQVTLFFTKDIWHHNADYHWVAVPYERPCNNGKSTRRGAVLAGLKRLVSRMRMIGAAYIH